MRACGELGGGARDPVFGRPFRSDRDQPVRPQARQPDQSAEHIGARLLCDGNETEHPVDGRHELVNRLDLSERMVGRAHVAQRAPVVVVGGGLLLPVAGQLRAELLGLAEVHVGRDEHLVVAEIDVETTAGDGRDRFPEAVGLAVSESCHGDAASMRRRRRGSWVNRSKGLASGPSRRDRASERAAAIAAAGGAVYTA